MIPSGNLLTEEFTEQEIPTKTWHIDEKQNRIVGMCDRLEAVMQAARLILSTERWQHLILPEDYGIETEELLGASEEFVRADIERRVREALSSDDRIEGLENVQITFDGDSCLFAAELVTIYGNAPVAQTFRR